MLARIKKNDLVEVVTGKDSGKRGSILLVNKISNTVVVQGINIVTKHVKARKQEQKSEIKKIEAPIHASNVMLVCFSCQKPSRINSVVTSDAQKKRIRLCNRCKQAI